MAVISQVAPGGATCFFKKEVKGMSAFRNKVVSRLNDRTCFSHGGSHHAFSREVFLAREGNKSLGRMPAFKGMIDWKVELF